MFKKSLIATSVAALAALGIAASASAGTTAPAATSVADFSVKFTSAKIVVAGLTEVEIPGSDPTLAGKVINVNGTINGAGQVSIGTSGFDFPAIGLGDSLPIPGVNLDIIQTAATTGTFNTTSGAVSLPLKLGVSLGADLGGGAALSCLIKGLNFTFTTGNVVQDSTTLFGSPWNKTTRALTLTGKSAIPDSSKISAADCPIVGLLAGAGISGKAVLLKLVGTTTIGAYKAPAVATLPKSLPATVKFVKGKNTVIVTCAATTGTTANRDCAGTLQVDVGTTKGTPVSFAAKAGKTANVELKLSNSQVTAIGSKTKAAVITLALAGSKTPTTKSVQVKNTK
jgi:hypothetical protein